MQERLKFDDMPNLHFDDCPMVVVVAGSQMRLAASSFSTASGVQPVAFVLR